MGLFSGVGSLATKMYSSRSKIIKPNNERLDEFEQNFNQAVHELESNSDLKAPLRGLYFTGAKDTDIGNGKKAIILFVPPPQLTQVQKIQSSLVRELEKKFSGKHIVVIAQRRILPKETRKSTNKSKQQRPRSRTLTSVHEKILEDLVFPAEIIGKRTRVKLDA